MSTYVQPSSLAAGAIYAARAGSALRRSVRSEEYTFSFFGFPPVASGDFSSISEKTVAFLKERAIISLAGRIFQARSRLGL